MGRGVGASALVPFSPTLGFGREEPGPEDVLLASPATPEPTPRTALREAVKRKEEVQSGLLVTLRKKQADLASNEPTEDELAAAQWGTADPGLMDLMKGDQEDVLTERSSDVKDRIARERAAIIKQLQRDRKKAATADSDPWDDRTRHNEFHRDKRAIVEVASPKSYEEAKAMAKALDNPYDSDEDPSLPFDPTTQAGKARQKRLEQAAKVWNRPKAIHDRFFEMHAYLGDPDTHKRLMDQRNLDAPKPVKQAPPQRGFFETIFNIKPRKYRRRKGDPLPPKVGRRKDELEDRKPVPDGLVASPDGRYVGTKESLRVQFPRRMDAAREVAITQEEGYHSATVRGMLRAPPPPDRPALNREDVFPKWGHRNWLKRRKPPMPEVSLKMNSGLEKMKRRIEAMRLNKLYHVTLTEKFEEQTRRAGLTQAMRE